VTRIDSPQHPTIKRTRRLHDPDERRASGLFLAEGVRLLEEAFASGLTCENFFYNAALLERPNGEALLARARRAKAPLVEVSERALAALKETKTTQGAVGLFRQPTPATPWERPLRRGLVVIGCEIRDPGNLGTMIRMSEAAGARGLLLTGGTVDPYHPKALRASMGSLFRLPVVVDEKFEGIVAGAQIIAAVAEGGRAPWEVDLTRPTFLLMGQEAAGLPESMLKLATERVTIPIAPHVESLNVAMAAAVLLYEAIRQRGRV